MQCDLPYQVNLAAKFGGAAAAAQQQKANPQEKKKGPERVENYEAKQKQKWMDEHFAECVSVLCIFASLCTRASRV